MQAHTSAHVECIGLAALDRAGPLSSDIPTTVPTTVEFIADPRLRVDEASHPLARQASTRLDAR